MMKAVKLAMVFVLIVSVFATVLTSDTLARDEGLAGQDDPPSLLAS